MAENPHPIYSGEQYRVAPAPQSHVPSSVSPAVQMAAEGSQKVHENISEFEAEGVDRAEYTLDLQRQKYTSETEAAINADIDKKFTLPDGHKDSFYDITGKFREDYYADYVAKVKARFDNLHLGYIRPDSQLRASEASEKIKSQLVKSLDAKLAINLAPRARAAVTKLLDHQLGMGDFIGARATVAGAPDFAMSDREKEFATSRIERASTMNSIENAALAGDTEAYLALISDDALMGKLSPDERKRALAMQRSLSFQSTATESTTSDKASGKDSDKAAKTQSPAHMGLPQGVPDALVKLYDSWNLHSDKDAMKSEEMQREARKALDSFAASFVVPDMPTEDILHFRSVASCFGITSADADLILDKHQKALKPTKGFDLTNQLTHAKSHLFTPRTIQKKLETLRKSRADALAKGSVDEDALKTYNAAIKLQKDSIENFNDALEVRCRTRYSDWLSAQGNGEQLTDADRNVAFMNILDQEKEKLLDEYQLDFLDDIDDISNSFEYRSAVNERTALQERTKQAYERRKALGEDIAQTNTRRLEESARAESNSALESQQQEAEKTLPRFAETDISFSAGRSLPSTYSQAYLAVPKDDQLAGKSVSFKVNGRTHTFECRATVGVETPTFSVAGQASMGLLGSRTVYRLAYDADGHAALVSASPKPSDFNMYKALMGNEARRDKAGRIAVYYPSAADGGGAYEVAGINQKYHPKMAAKLKGMVESGASNEEIEAEVMAYYKEYTQQGADLVNTATQSKGIELFIRDCTLNHGLEGTARVIRRALGLGKDDNVAPAVADFVSKYGEQRFLEALVQGRASYYAAIIQSKPEKQQFAKGWANRLRNISRASFAILRQRSDNEQ